MPEAEPFAALGRGNGFPYCLIKSDISSFTYWVTLGDYKKTDADSGVPVTQEQIDLSFENAMRLFWNIYRLNIDVEVVGEKNGVSDTITYDFFGVNFFNENNEEIEEAEPFKRVCQTSSNRRVGSAIPEDEENKPGYWANQLEWGVNIHRYYNGDSSNEGNFIGYGLGNLLLNSTLGAVSDRNSSSSSIRCIARYALDSITPFGISTSDAVGYTTVSGIPLVYAARAIAATSSPSDPPETETVSSSGAIAIAPTYGTTAKIENPSFEFYTYSAT